MVVIPYVSGLSERVRRIFKKHNVESAMRPHQTLKKLLVHPKDKRDKLKTGNCIYEIGCQNCDLTYVGETSRLFGTRLAEHQAEAKKANQKKFTRAERRTSEQEQTKSAVSDHVARDNHVINWDDAAIIGREHNKKSREVREAMEIRKRGAKTMNREEGTFFLSHVYYPLLKTGKQSTTNRKPVSRQSGSDVQI